MDIINYIEKNQGKWIILIALFFLALMQLNAQNPNELSKSQMYSVELIGHGSLTTNDDVDGFSMAYGIKFSTQPKHSINKTTWIMSASFHRMTFWPKKEFEDIPTISSSKGYAVAGSMGFAFNEYQNITGHIGFYNQLTFGDTQNNDVFATVVGIGSDIVYVKINEYFKLIAGLDVSLLLTSPINQDVKTDTWMVTPHLSVKYTISDKQ